MEKKKRYVQFSKKIIIFVTMSVTLLCIIGLSICYKKSDISQLTSIIKAYIEFATIAFVAYSGNSAVQKWLISKATISMGSVSSEQDETSEDDNG